MATLLSFLQNSKTTSQFLQIHAQSITNTLFSNPSFPTNLLFALAKLTNPPQSLSYVNLLFSQIQNPDAFAYNNIIRLHSKTSKPHLSIHFFIQMKRNCVQTDNYTYPFLLKASSSIPDPIFAATIHGEVLKSGFGSDVFVNNSLITSYSKSGEIGPAREVFDGFRCKDLVSWNSMMAGCVDCGELEEAQKLFDEMPERDAFSWAILIDGYGKGAGEVDRARELFDRVSDRDLVCWNAMVGGYSSVGDMESARELFESMPNKNVVSWSIMIDGYVRHGDPKAALDLFRLMLCQRSTKPDRVSVVGAITACAQLGALYQGRLVHSYLKKKKISVDVVVKTCLIDMYMKCGRLDLARRLFDGMQERTVVTWNVMIVGLGTNGHGAEAIELFLRMEKEGAFMDDLTILGVLTACTHGGLVEEGLEIFDRMRTEFGFGPKVEHYGCLVDLLGRAGRLDEAKDVIRSMPVEPTPALWGSLLAACRVHRCVDLAEHAVARLASLGADDSGVYVLLSNIYAEEGIWDGVWRMRKLIGERGVKETGRSVIEDGGEVIRSSGVAPLGVQQ